MSIVIPDSASPLPVPFVMTPLLTLRRTLAGTTHSIAAPVAQAIGVITAQQVQVTWHLSSALIASSPAAYPIVLGGVRYGSVTLLPGPRDIPLTTLHQEMQRLANECRDLVHLLTLVQWQRWQRSQPVPCHQDPVTTREHDILLHCFAGHSRQEIAACLHITPMTVKTHLRNLYTKLGVHRMQEALAVGRAAGLLLHLL